MGTERVNDCFEAVQVLTRSNQLRHAAIERMWHDYPRGTPNALIFPAAIIRSTSALLIRDRAATSPEGHHTERFARDLNPLGLGDRYETLDRWMVLARGIAERTLNHAAWPLPSCGAGPICLGSQTTDVGVGPRLRRCPVA